MGSCEDYFNSFPQLHGIDGGGLQLFLFALAVFFNN
jgi:hypothetical protein